MAVEAKTRRWVVSASSRPPPNATEESAVMDGMGSLEMEVKVWRKEKRKSDVLKKNDVLSCCS